VGWSCYAYFGERPPTSRRLPEMARLPVLSWPPSSGSAAARCTHAQGGPSPVPALRPRQLLGRAPVADGYKGATTRSTLQTTSRFFCPMSFPRPILNGLPWWLIWIIAPISATGARHTSMSRSRSGSSSPQGADETGSYGPRVTGSSGLGLDRGYQKYRNDLGLWAARTGVALSRLPP